MPKVPSAGVLLDADLTVPAHAKGVVLFAHGSGSSRLSPRNRLVAERLNAAGLATVLTDLLTAEEEEHDALTGELRFDIGLLAGRLTGVADWIAAEAALAALPLGLFGASTGAAAALMTAAARPRQVRAVVSRGGRPDLAGAALTETEAPVLLIVGERDERVLELNRAAAGDLAVSSVWVVGGATHLFEEPGALEEVAGAAADWFDQHLAGEGLKLGKHNASGRGPGGGARR
ncbi:dienelactone hydrolase family protein [Dactylosporangium sp. CA-139066]|uniref:dienelactone hydrolase family protein n=1 Tax=Dactylosporangium sp. CA-139066 TaxID=3239930 RepID=UPI003D8C06C6